LDRHTRIIGRRILNFIRSSRSDRIWYRDRYRPRRLCPDYRRLATLV
jgi:hypothetical protein